MICEHNLRAVALVTVNLSVVFLQSLPRRPVPEFVFHRFAACAEHFNISLTDVKCLETAHLMNLGSILVVPILGRQYLCCSESSDVIPAFPTFITFSSSVA